MANDVAGAPQLNAFGEQRGSRNTRLERLQALTDAALASLDLEQLLSSLLLRTSEMLDTDTCAVLLLDEKAGELVARAAVGLEEEVERGVRIPLGRGFAGRVAAERRPVILDDVDHAHVLNPILREKGIKSLLGVPLQVGAGVIGVIHVGTLQHRAFTSDDAELLQLAADRAALAIEHARAFEAERSARERLEDIQAVTDAALAHLALDELLEVLLPRIRTILRADTCAVLLLDEQAGELVARAAVGLEEEVERRVRIPLGRGFAGRVATQRRPIVLDDLQRADIVNPILRERGIQSMCGVPLLVRDQVIGVLHVGVLTHRTFAPSDVELLELVAARVAIAIERAQLHEKTVLLDQFKANFVAIASHELRTPATAVYGVMTTLASLGDSLSTEVRDELLETGVSQGERLRRLLDELLDLSQLDSQSIRIHLEPLALRPLLGEIATSVVPAGVKVLLDVPDALAVVADRRVLEHVVSNLLSNAVHHGEPPLVITARSYDRHLRITVADEGPGIPADLQARLFDRFVRGADSGGSGLGLAIARAFARAHGGDILYDPRDKGSQFTLVVPTGIAR
jgi:signal transduction histidine kinase